MLEKSLSNNKVRNNFHTLKENEKGWDQKWETKIELWKREIEGLRKTTFYNLQTMAPLSWETNKKLGAGGEDIKNFLSGSNLGQVERTALNFTGHIQDVEEASCGGKHAPVRSTLPLEEKREGVVISSEMHA